MATRENFLLQIALSDDEYESSPQFRSGALPKLTIPSPFQSEESSQDVESDSGAETPSTPGTPVTPLSPLGTEFSFLGVSSQTVRKEECLGHAQKRLKKHLVKSSSLQGTARQ